MHHSITVLKSSKPPIMASKFTVVQPKLPIDYSTKPPKAPPRSRPSSEITVSCRDVRERESLNFDPAIPPPPPPFIESATIDPAFIPSFYVSQNLVFAQIDDDDETKGYEAQFYLKNVGSDPMVFRVKSSCPTWLNVEPAWGILDPQDFQILEVQTIDKNGDGRLFSLFKEDELQVECTLCPSENMNMAAISAFWAGTPAELGDVERYTCKRFMLWDSPFQAHEVSTCSAQNTYEIYTDVLPAPPPLPQEDASGISGMKLWTGITLRHCQLTIENLTSLASLVIIFWILLLAMIAFPIFIWFSDIEDLISFESYFNNLFFKSL